MNELGLLYRFVPTELAPPDDMWDRIVQVMDRNKQNMFGQMEALEIPPPPSAWDNIVLALEKEESSKSKLSFAETCLQMELEPPSFAWNGIEKMLDAEKTPVRKIVPAKKKIERAVAIGLAIAACLTGVVFFVGNKSANLPANNTDKVAITNTKPSINTQTNVTPVIVPKTDSEKKQTDISSVNKLTALVNPLTSQSTNGNDNTEKTSELEKINQSRAPLINTTNNKVASLSAKPRDENGNITTKMGDYFSKEGFVVVMGPNGNSVNLSSKLIDLIPFLQGDSTNAPEEYLDKVMRESSIWHQKLTDWKNKVDAADAQPSQMNFIDPIDLMRFLQKNK